MMRSTTSWSTIPTDDEAIDLDDMFPDHSADDATTDDIVDDAADDVADDTEAADDVTTTPSDVITTRNEPEESIVDTILGYVTSIYGIIAAAVVAVLGAVSLVYAPRQ